MVKDLILGAWTSQLTPALPQLQPSAASSFLPPRTH